MSVLHLLSSGNFITVNRTLIKSYGLDAAVMLGELASEFLYWDERGAAEGGWFYSTVENVEQNAGLTAHEQRNALVKLAEAGLVEVKRGGMPAKRYIRIVEDAVVKNFNNKSLKILTTSDQNFEQQDVKNFNVNNNKEKKNRKKELSNKYVSAAEPLLDTVPVIANNPELRTAFIDFVKMRAFIKHPLDEGGIKRIINKVYKLGGGNAETMCAILDQSVENTWRGVFPLREARTAAKANTSNEFDALLEREGNYDAD